MPGRSTKTIQASPLFGARKPTNKADAPCKDPNKFKKFYGGPKKLARCVKPSSKTMCGGKFPSWDANRKTCLPKPDKTCPNGKVLNPISKRCKLTPKPDKICPNGKVYNPTSKRCKLISTTKLPTARSVAAKKAAATRKLKKAISQMDFSKPVFS